MTDCTGIQNNFLPSLSTVKLVTPLTNGSAIFSFLVCLLPLSIAFTMHIQDCMCYWPHPERNVKLTISLQFHLSTGF